MAPPPSSVILPALSIALGLPLCHRDTSRVNGHSNDEVRSPNTSRQTDADKIKNSVSRIYARRLMDRADLERSHPWLLDESTELNALHSVKCKQDWNGKDKLISHVLSSLIDLKYNTETSVCPPVASLLPRSSIAACESFNFPSGTKHDARDRTLNAYNSLSIDAGATKPKEWGDEIDLEQRRAEFGQKISPLSNTSRLERWGMAAKRMGTLGMLAAPLGVLVPLNWMVGGLSGEAGDKENKSALQHYRESLTQKTWDYALWAVETAGPTYIKLAQWASTRNDLFSPEFVGHFSKLQDETRGHSWKETEASLEKAYGKDWRKVLSFEKFEEDHSGDSVDNQKFKGKGDKANRDRQKRLEKNEAKSASTSSSPTIPIGSGCVAQVYKARLRQSHGLHPAGTSVAVKVQHPRILEKVCLDFYLMNKFASFLEYIPYLNLDYLSMKDSVDQFRDIVLPQLDLRVEAHNLRRFRRDFADETQIAFPEPLSELTSREVLVEKFVEGEPMLNFVMKEDESHSKKDRQELARVGLEAVMKMIFLHDFVHADLVRT